MGESSQLSSASNLQLSAGRGKELDLAPWIIHVVIPARMRVRVGVTLSLSPSHGLDPAEEPTESKNYSGIPPVLLYPLCPNPAPHKPPDVLWNPPNPVPGSCSNAAPSTPPDPALESSLGTL